MLVLSSACIHDYNYCCVVALHSTLPPFQRGPQTAAASTIGASTIGIWLRCGRLSMKLATVAGTSVEGSMHHSPTSLRHLMLLPQLGYWAGRNLYRSRWEGTRPTTECQIGTRCSVLLDDLKA